MRDDIRTRRDDRLRIREVVDMRRHAQPARVRLGDHGAVDGRAHLDRYATAEIVEPQLHEIGLLGRNHGDRLAGVFRRRGAEQLVGADLEPRLRRCAIGNANPLHHAEQVRAVDPSGMRVGAYPDEGWAVIAERRYRRHAVAAILGELCDDVGTGIVLGTRLRAAHLSDMAMVGNEAGDNGPPPIVPPFRARRNRDLAGRDDPSLGDHDRRIIHGCAAAPVDQPDTGQRDRLREGGPGGERRCGDGNRC